MTIHVQRKGTIVAYLSRIFFPLFVLVAVVFVCGYQILASVNNPELSERSDIPGPSLQGRASRSTKGKMVDIKSVEFSSPDYPSDIDSSASNVTVSASSITVMGVNTFYREALPPTGVQGSNQMVLLLHGAAFKSETWLNLNTINLLAAMGHHVIAVDLPGYGETRMNLGWNVDKGDFLKRLIDSIKLSNFVIVSPSMSGEFSIPYLIKNHRDMDGFVPVAPVKTGALVREGPQINTPTLIIYGSEDKGLGTRSKSHLSNLPNHKSFVLEGAKHPAYLDQPKMFHTLLYNFLKTLKG